MNTTNILIVSDNRLSAADIHGWKGFETFFSGTDETAIEIVNRQPFDMVVIDHTSPYINAKKLSAVLPLLCEGIEIVHYDGEPLSVLKNKIATVFARQKNERVRRYLVLDATEMHLDQPLFPFSAN